VKLAERLVTASTEVEDGGTRYVMLVEARDAAVTAGNAGLALQAIDQLDENYSVDALGLKVAVLEQLSQNARGISVQKEIAQNGVALVAKAVEAKRLDEALRLAELSVEAAKEARSVSLLREARTVYQQVEALRSQR
jgi:hypothetical protein